MKAQSIQVWLISEHITDSLETSIKSALADPRLANWTYEELLAVLEPNF